MDLADEALHRGQRQEAWDYIHRVCLDLADDTDSKESKALYIKACLDLSQLGFVLGKNINELTMLLTRALESAELMGDRRSRALINLHLGRLYYFGQRRNDAARAFKKGYSEVKELGDEDILARSAEFLGLHYFTRGLINEAFHYFELGLENFETGKSNMPTNVLTSMWLGYCAAYMGQFHRAIGTLDYYRRFCLERGDQSSAAILRAVLGIVLLMAKKNRDAYYHLSNAELEAKQNENPLAYYFAKGGLTYHLFVEGQLEESHDKSEQLFREAQEAGWSRQYASPIFLELYHEYYRLGFKPIMGENFQTEVIRLLQEPNIMLRGVALRLRATDKIVAGNDVGSAKEDLEKSRQYLTQSGASVQLAKTLVELARLALIDGRREEAHTFASQAFKELGGYEKDFYPDDLRYLLRSKTVLTDEQTTSEELFTRFMDIIEELEPDTDFDQILYRVVKATNRLLGAERGGILWFDSNHKKAPVLRAAHNLTPTNLQEEDFLSNMALVFEAFRTKKPQLVQKDAQQENGWHYQCKAVLCIPFEVAGKTTGVLYYDNSYVDGCFDMIGPGDLNRMAQSISRYIERLYAHSMKIRNMSQPQAHSAPGTPSYEIISRSPAMTGVLDQADRVAATDSSILILGKTGVGKELVARRIHDKSRRAERPLIIVDPSTIPETLVESELFGHEKGAFTGADRQKKGRLELAHGGTLFIDEIGDIPLPVQVKLLRVLQEKTIMRVGSTRTLFTDFRLIAATNRDIAHMVAKGEFREDLYYRINVVPIYIPPLCQRIEDISLLSGHFLNRYAAKYHRTEFQLSVEDENRLKAYNWPGNVRELKNVLERASLLSREGELELNLPVGTASPARNPFEDLPSMEDIQRRYIQYVLKQTNGKQSGPKGAAEILGMNRSTLYNRMRKLGILSPTI
jgi:transcriptional regulator with GAF, ATPase, and Fis domain